MSARWGITAFVLAAVAACGPAPHTEAAGGIDALAIRPVVWNPAQAPVGRVRAVADNGEAVCIFADDGATVLSSTGALVAHDTHVKNWVAGDSIYAVGESGKWIVGVDTAGHLYRLKAMNAFEDVGARYQLSAKKIHSAVTVGAGRDGFLLDDEVAFSDPAHIAVFGSSMFSSFAGGGGFGAGVVDGAVLLLNAANGSVTRFVLPGATWAALDSKGRLYAATKRAVYEADVNGTLVLVYDANADGIHGLVASGNRVWFADRGELGAIDDARVALSKGANIDPSASLQGSTSGDVWVVAQTLSRFTTGAPAGTQAPPAPTVASSWTTLIAPAFARSCAKCHQPEGVSGVDLSTEAAWTAKKSLINDRVIVTHTMPPPGMALGDADREAIHTWLSGR